MSTEKLARCLGELQQLLPRVEEAALRKEIGESVETILHKMHDYCLVSAQKRLTKVQQSTDKKTPCAGLSLADPAIRKKKVTT